MLRKRPYDLCRAFGGDVDRGCGGIGNVCAGIATAVCAEHAEIIEIAESVRARGAENQGSSTLREAGNLGDLKDLGDLCAKCASRSRRRAAPSTLRSKPDRTRGAPKRRLPDPPTTPLTPPSRTRPMTAWPIRWRNRESLLSPDDTNIRIAAQAIASRRGDYSASTGAGSTNGLSTSDSTTDTTTLAISAHSAM